MQNNAGLPYLRPCRESIFIYDFSASRMRIHQTADFLKPRRLIRRIRPTQSFSGLKNTGAIPVRPETAPPLFPNLTSAARTRPCPGPRPGCGRP
jgi:hypothetical protein